MMLKDIAGYLQGQGLGDVGSTIFMGYAPHQPDQALILYAYAGNPPQTLAGVESPGLQVVARADGYAKAEYMLATVRNALLAIGNEQDGSAEGVMLGGRHYFRVAAAASGSTPMGVDEGGRTLLAQSFILTREDAKYDE